MKTTPDNLEQFFREIAFTKVENESELNYKDPFITKEQRKRDELITELLEEYVLFYKSKVKHSKICRYIILIPCVIIILAFSSQKNDLENKRENARNNKENAPE